MPLSANASRRSTQELNRLAPQAVNLRLTDELNT
jgi:hypothetical protein